jgi:hypothetical protein
VEKTNWLRLDGALEIISASTSSLSEFDRKTVLCRWMSQQKVGIRVKIPGSESPVYVGISVPPRLGPDDLDWPQSRPLHLWIFGAVDRGPGTMQHRFNAIFWDSTQDEKQRRIELLEVNEDHLCGAINHAITRFQDRVFLQIRELLALLMNGDRARFDLIDDDDLRIAIRRRDRVVPAVLSKLQEGCLTAYDQEQRPQDKMDYWIGKTALEVVKRAHFWVNAEETLIAWPELRATLAPVSNLSMRRVGIADRSDEPVIDDVVSPKSDETVSTDGPRPLTGNALQVGLKEWVKATWGPDFSQLPGREELLSLARKKPEFSRATDKHMRKLREKYATDASKLGGAPYHRSRRGNLGK